MNTIKIAGIALLASALVACGGSSSSDGNGSSSTPSNSSVAGNSQGESSSTAQSSVDVSSSEQDSSSASNSSLPSVDPTTIVDRTWGSFPDNQYVSILESAVGTSNNPVAETLEPVALEGLLFLRSGADESLRHRGSNAEFNFNGPSFTDGNDVTVPAMGAQAPEMRAFIAVPVEPGRAVTLTAVHRNSSGSAGAGKIVFVGSDGLVLNSFNAASNKATTSTLELESGHAQEYVKIGYSREGATTGGMHFSSLSRIYNEPSEHEPSSSADSTSSAGSHSSVGGGDLGELREAKIEGFAAYAGVTGGAGGPVYIVSTGTELNKALCGERRTNRSAPVIILVNGTINHGNTTAQGCDTQASLIEIKNTSNVSIIGVGENALFDQIGIHLRSASNIIIQNVHIRNVKKSGSPTSNGGDAIGMERDVDRVWIDHNWLEASGGEKNGYDSLLDMKDGTTNVTVSYNLFNDSSRGGLIGSSDSDNKNGNITFHHNWYKNIEQRTPLIRNALVHTYNNYWSNENRSAMIHGINARMATEVLVESNYFQNVNNPLLAGTESAQAGCWQTNNDNILVDHIYTRTNPSTGAHAIPAIVDGQMQSNCSVSVPYAVDMDPAADVPSIVMANAGVGKIAVDTSGSIPVPSTP